VCDRPLGTEYFTFSEDQSSPTYNSEDGYVKYYPKVIPEFEYMPGFQDFLILGNRK
jgi:hypothetical protein